MDNLYESWSRKCHDQRCHLELQWIEVLDKCLHALAEQTWNDFEVIVVDNASMMEYRIS